MKNFWSGFEKKAGLSAKQRESYEKEMHAYNQEHAGNAHEQIGRQIPLHALTHGAAGAIIGGMSGGPKRALLGGAIGTSIGGLAGMGIGAYSAHRWKNKSPEYLKHVTDENLERGIQDIRKAKNGGERRFGYPRTDEERAERHGSKDLPPRGTGLRAISGRAS
jgi:hypothetical protein